MSQDRVTWPPYLLEQLDGDNPTGLRAPASAAGLHAALGTGPVTYRLTGAGGVLVDNHTTGRHWRRLRSGRWVEWGVTPVPVAQRIARLMVDCMCDERLPVDRVAAALRQAVTPWLPLLRQARNLAETHPDVSALAGRRVFDAVLAMMEASEGRPHRLVMVISDPAALAAAFDAEADLEARPRDPDDVDAGGPGTATMRWAAGVVRSTGPGQWPMPGQYDVRGTGALDALVAALGAKRPGQRFLLEPIPA